MKKLIAFLLTSVILLSLGACSSTETPPTEISHVQKLYSYNGTNIGDASKTRAIAELTKSSKYAIENGIELETTTPPYGITIRYQVPDRNEYYDSQFANEQEDRTMAAQYFVLVLDCEFVKVQYDDEYKEGFAIHYLTPQSLTANNQQYTSELFEKARKSQSEFDNFYEIINRITEEDLSKSVVLEQMRSDHIRQVIGQGREVTANSGLSVTIQPTTANQAKMDKYGLLEDLDHSLMERELTFQTYRTTDFAGENTEDYLFIFDGVDVVSFRKLESDEEAQRIIQGLEAASNTSSRM